MAELLNEYEAAILLKMSPNLLKWFTSYAPKYQDNRKLKCVNRDGDLFYSPKDLLEFDQFLSEPWPSKARVARPNVPSGIEEEIKSESNFRCAICDHTQGTIAHIDPIYNSKNNHPHNLIYLCPNCHALYDKKKGLTRKQIQNLKDDILQTKLVIWKSYTSLLDSISCLIKELETVSTYDFNNKNLKEQMICELLDEINKHVAKEFNDHPRDIKKHEKHKTYENYKNNLREILSENRDVVQKVINERNAYIVKSDEAECPLCEGSGVHNDWPCPVCRGVGTVDQRALDHIDLSPYEQEECPLCEGSGDHNDWRCPICRGVGTVDQRALDHIDLSLYEQEECPLCEGSGDHNDWPCPVCRGVGTVDQRALDHIDLSPYEQEECPLCEGSGDHNDWPCPVCRGVGTVDQEALDHIDLSPYEQEECPLCKGSGDHNNRPCPVCRGVGTVDQEALDHIDLSPYEQEECPLCEGSGEHNDWPCPVCAGVGTVDQEALDHIDLSPYEQEE